MIKAALLFSLVVLVLGSGNQGDHEDSLDDLLTRVLDRLQARRRSEDNRHADRVVSRGTWDSYIDILIAQSKDASGTAHVDRACIIGLDGGAPWTTAAHPNALQLIGDEGATIARVFKSKDFATFITNGVYAEGTKYSFLREEDSKVVYAKKKSEGALTMQTSKTAIVIAHCPEGSQQGNANRAVGVIADYLESLGM